jgi:hypothetical protein
MIVFLLMSLVGAPSRHQNLGFAFVITDAAAPVDKGRNNIILVLITTRFITSASKLMLWVAFVFFGILGTNMKHDGIIS